AKAIEFMIKAGIIKVPTTTSGDITEEKKIPNWIKSNAGWWADDLISDDDFVKGIQYLVENKIIRV
ncbi:MAG: peptidase, partial [Nitrosopumilaceae archaeon]